MVRFGVRCHKYAALSRLDPDLSVTRLRGSETARVRNLGIFEILLSREGIDTDLPPGRALSVIGDLFERRAEGGDFLVVVDNADLVDDHSLAVLAQLTDARRIKLVIAAESVRSPVDLIAGLWLAGSVVRIDLDGIDEADAVAMINSTVKNRLSALYRKFGVTNRAGVLRRARSSGFLADSQSEETHT
jgi:hypothetical protein